MTGLVTLGSLDDFTLDNFAAVSRRGAPVRIGAGARGGDAAALRLALLILAPTGFWATYHFYLATKTIVADQISAIGHGIPESP